MKNPKIVIDTNVIVAASILENISELGVQIKHHFYDQSRQLFSIFSKRPNEKIGIAVPTVKHEAFLVLSKAVKRTFLDSLYDKNIQSKKVFFDNAVGLVNSSDHKMRYLFSLLLHKTPKERYLRISNKKVKEMSMYIRDLWNYKYNRRYKKEKQAKERAKPIFTEPKWKEEQKKEVLDAYREQVRIEAIQIEKFMRKYPNPGDQRILAETITIKDDYFYSGEDYKFYIASCDSGFFSPMIWHNPRSSLVTEEIEERFKISCNLPKVIFWNVSRQIGLL